MCVCVCVCVVNTFWLEISIRTILSNRTWIEMRYRPYINKKDEDDNTIDIVDNKLYARVYCEIGFVGVPFFFVVLLFVLLYRVATD